MSMGETLLQQNTEIRNFEVISPVLNPAEGEDAEWILSDGSRKYSVIMEDEDFLRDTWEGEIGFRSHCGIVCEIETKTWFSLEGVRSEYRVKRVLEMRDWPL